MQVISVNISEHTGTVKHPVPEILIDETGIHGDAHAGVWHRQVSLLSRDITAAFEKETGRQIAPGEFAENITLDGTDLRSVCLLDRFHANDVELEVTQIGKACHGDGCAIFKEVGVCVMPRDGVFCRVVQGGSVRPGDTFVHHERTLRCRVITLSDRASRGEYEDGSGPRIETLVGRHLQGKRWRAAFDRQLLPDDAEELRAALSAARDADADMVFTTGGTGVGPRDMTPEVVTALADRTIPGIMEAIRVKYGERKPNALLSRSVAAVMGRTLVYALPGSVKAVEEYVPEILKTIDHLLFVLRGVERSSEPAPQTPSHGSSPRA